MVDYADLDSIWLKVTMLLVLALTASGIALLLRWCKRLHSTVPGAG